MKNVIFLDVDGVLNDAATEDLTPDGFIGLSTSMIGNLKSIVDATGAVIVLTSTWKDEWDKNPVFCEVDGRYLADMLAQQGLHITDKTIDATSDRGRGIARYLKAHPSIERWVVLDDDVFPDYQANGIMPHLVHTSFGCGGLTQALAEKAIDLLTTGGEKP